jgi:hypothetical protein
MALCSLRIDPKGSDVMSSHIGPRITELAELLAADQGVIAGVEDQHNILAAQGG